jgi:hypothetical protein
VPNPVHPVTGTTRALELIHSEDGRVRDLASAALDLAKQADAAREFLLLSREIHGPTWIEVLSFGHRPSAAALLKLSNRTFGEVPRG